MTDEYRKFAVIKWTGIVIELADLMRQEVAKFHHQGQPGKALLFAAHTKHIIDTILEQECFEEKEKILM